MLTIAVLGGGEGLLQGAAVRICPSLPFVSRSSRVDCSKRNVISALKAVLDYIEKVLVVESGSAVLILGLG